MNTITFTCETITPMFLSGADTSVPELRPPSIKGAMRFWWRAMNGHLSLEELKKREDEIFGSTERKSSFSLCIKNHRETESRMTVMPYKPVPRDEKKFSLPAFNPKQQFEIIVRSNNESVFTIKQLDACFKICVALGGLGKRSRRGFGAVGLKGWEIATLQDILDLILTVEPGLAQYFSINGKVLLSAFKHYGKYPVIKKIELGRERRQLPELVAEQTHLFKERDFQNMTFEYEASMGHTKERFASPVYVSAFSLSGSTAPIITTLNTVPDDRHKHKINLDLQKEFIQKIL